MQLTSGRCHIVHELSEVPAGFLGLHLELQVRLGIANSSTSWHSIDALPDLSNVHFLEKGLNWTTLAYIVFVCLAAATSFLLALFAGRVTSAKDTELKQMQSSSAEVVAHAQAGAARANAQAAMAYQEQRRLEADMEHARAHHEQLRKENLELQLVVEKERTARLRLEQQLGARHIGTVQRHTIQSEMARFRGQKVSIVTHPGDPEIAAFASEIKATLEAAGMTVTLTPALVFGKPQAGIAWEVGAHRRPFAMALAKAFVDAGVCSGAISASEPDDADLMEITVGSK
jgi:hypothetical protein